MLMNKVTLMGRLTKDPEIRYGSTNNMAVVKFTVAVDRRYSKDTEERQADYISCTSFGKTAEFINNYFTKGRQIALFGRINTGSYEKDGQKFYTTDVIVDDVYFTGSKKDNESSGFSPSSEGSSNDSGFTPINDSQDELPF
jgi:single-strand DNA-binding protein